MNLANSAGCDESSHLNKIHFPDLFADLVKFVAEILFSSNFRSFRFVIIT